MMIDTTHPYVDEQGIKEMIEAVKEYGGATLGQRQWDTCYQIDENDMLTAVIPRQQVVSGASPEGFKFKTIYDIYKNSTKEELEKMTSAGAIALAHNVKMKVCTLNTLNLKITYPSDLEILKHIIDFNFKGDVS
jgi:2-C-methyl-D-erythritol 4-phosphate cytidylyltransferase